VTHAVITKYRGDPRHALSRDNGDSHRGDPGDNLRDDSGDAPSTSASEGQGDDSTMLAPRGIDARPRFAIWPGLKRALKKVRNYIVHRTAVSLLALSILQLDGMALVQQGFRMESGSSGNLAACSLTTAYALIATAIGMLGTASALAGIFFNIPALSAAIGLVATVALVIIPKIRSELEAYERCRGPSERCRLDLNINTLGQAAMLVALGAWTIALVLQVLALTHFGTLFLAWLGALELGTSEVLKWGGVASNVAAAGVLVGLTSTVIAYQACRDSEDRPSRPGEPAPIG
jgi:hypothetical protein